ncbi:MAG: Uma2 family endonuclease [Pirellulales bacterium]
MSGLSALNTTDYGTEPCKLVLRPLLRLDEEQFYQLTLQNPEQPLEQNAQGEVIIVSPTGGSSGHRNGDILYQLIAWNKQHGRGVVFDSSTIFRLPLGAARSPDASWVELSRWTALTQDQRDRFPPFCPDFVIELRSNTDRLADLQAKLVEYMNNGARLGWIVDPLLKQVHLYEPGNTPRVLDEPAFVEGTDCMTGFVLELKDVFAA